jgi:glycosyltransferase involved in cell wall biosynthesis
MNEDIGKKISVCLITFNHVQAIKSTLDSILDQSITDYEVVVSDDCSTDGTWELILELAKEDARIRPIRTPHNMGMACNANFAVAECNRPYIALLHHDDLYRRDLLEKWADILERYDDVSFVFNPYDDPPDPERQYGPRLKQEHLEGRWLLENRFFKRWGSPVRGTAMIRRSWWDRVGGMRERFNMLADVDLWMRLSRLSHVGYVPETLIRRRAIRPDYYPSIYTGDMKWHWKRWTLIYEIHAANMLDYLAPGTLKGKLQWWNFRARLSFETAKWLIYAVVRNRREMIATCHESATSYDFWPLRALRRVIQLTARPIGN